MHIPIVPVAKTVRVAFEWLKAVLGLGFPQYPKYLRNGEEKYSDLLLFQLCEFLNSAFEAGYKAYDVCQLRSWLHRTPDLYLIVLDRVAPSRRPRTPQIVGTYKLVPLGSVATERALAGILEVIDISANEMEKDLTVADGIWIGDLSVISPLRSAASGVLGRHLLESVKQSLRPYKGKVPIFCRSERHDIQQFLLRQGFYPLHGGEITGKTIWLLPTERQAYALRTKDA